jgi:hypothetical protein
VFGTLPIGFESFERSAHALVGDLLGDDPLCEADLGNQFPCPGAAILAECAGAAVQYILQTLGSFFREHRAQPMGVRRAFRQHGETLGIETVDHVAYGLVVAAQLACDKRGSFSASRSQSYLAAAQHKGI